MTRSALVSLLFQFFCDFSTYFITWTHFLLYLSFADPLYLYLVIFYTHKNLLQIDIKATYYCRIRKASVNIRLHSPATANNQCERERFRKDKSTTNEPKTHILMLRRPYFLIRTYPRTLTTIELSSPIHFLSPLHHLFLEI